MAYTKQNFADGQTLCAYQLNHIEDGIVELEKYKIPVKGVDYYTDADKAEIIRDTIAALPVYLGEVEDV